jgi:hypothetical protein
MVCLCLAIGRLHCRLRLCPPRSSPQYWVGKKTNHNEERHMIWLTKSFLWFEFSFLYLILSLVPTSRCLVAPPAPFLDLTPQCGEQERKKKKRIPKNTLKRKGMHSRRMSVLYVGQPPAFRRHRTYPSPAYARWFYRREGAAQDGGRDNRYEGKKKRRWLARLGGGNQRWTYRGAAGKHCFFLP